MVDVCLLDSALTMVEIPTSYYLSTGEEGGEGGRPPYRAKDGWVVIAAVGRDDGGAADGPESSGGTSTTPGGRSRRASVATGGAG